MLMAMSPSARSCGDEETSGEREMNWRDEERAVRRRKKKKRMILWRSGKGPERAVYEIPVN